MNESTAVCAFGISRRSRISEKKLYGLHERTAPHNSPKPLVEIHQQEKSRISPNDV